VNASVGASGASSTSPLFVQRACRSPRRRYSDRSGPEAWSNCRRMNAWIDCGEETDHPFIHFVPHVLNPP